MASPHIVAASVSSTRRQDGARSGKTTERGDRTCREDGARCTETILLAEDNAAVRALMIRILKRAGYHVLVARDGNEAVHLFDAHTTEIALAILDVMMPTLNGWQACSHMRATNPLLPVVFASGYCPDIIGTALNGARNATFIAKPFTPSALLAHVRDILDAQ